LKRTLQQLQQTTSDDPREITRLKIRSIAGDGEFLLVHFIWKSFGYFVCDSKVAKKFKDGDIIPITNKNDWRCGSIYIFGSSTISPRHVAGFSHKHDYLLKSFGESKTKSTSGHNTPGGSRPSSPAHSTPILTATPPPTATPPITALPTTLKADMNSSKSLLSTQFKPGPASRPSSPAVSLSGSCVKTLMDDANESSTPKIKSVVSSQSPMLKNASAKSSSSTQSADSPVSRSVSKDLTGTGLKVQLQFDDTPPNRKTVDDLRVEQPEGNSIMPLTSKPQMHPYKPSLKDDNVLPMPNLYEFILTKVPADVSSEELKDFLDGLLPKGSRASLTLTAKTKDSAKVTCKDREVFQHLMSKRPFVMWPNFRLDCSPHVATIAKFPNVVVRRSDRCSISGTNIKELEATFGAIYDDILSIDLLGKLDRASVTFMDPTSARDALQDGTLLASDICYQIFTMNE